MDIFEKCEEVFGKGSNEWMRLQTLRPFIAVTTVKHLVNNTVHVFHLTRSTGAHDLAIWIKEDPKDLLFTYVDKDQYANHQIVAYDNFVPTLKGASE